MVRVERFLRERGPAFLWKWIIVYSAWPGALYTGTIRHLLIKLLSSVCVLSNMRLIETTFADFIIILNVSRECVE